MPPVRLNMAKLSKKDDYLNSRDPDSSLTRSQRSNSQPRAGKFMGAFKQASSRDDVVSAHKVNHNASNLVNKSGVS